MANCPDASATTRSWGLPLRNNSTLAPGVALPATTASPDGSTRATSKAGLTSSPAPAKASGPAGAATFFATVWTVPLKPRSPPSLPSPACAGGEAGGDGNIDTDSLAASASTGRSRSSLSIESAAPAVATSASDHTNIRIVDVRAIVVHRRFCTCVFGGRAFIKLSCANWFRSASQNSMQGYQFLAQQAATPCGFPCDGNVKIPADIGQPAAATEGRCRGKPALALD